MYSTAATGLGHLPGVSRRSGRRAGPVGQGAMLVMARASEHRSASAVDLIIAATAAHHGLTVLHDDVDYRTVARHSPELSEHSIYDIA